MWNLNQEKKIQENIKISVILIAILFVLIIGSTIAYFSARSQTELQTVTTAKLSFNFTNGEIIRATNVMPISDLEIKTEATELPFSITNTGNQHANIRISLTDITISEELKDVDFRWGLYNADTGVGLNYGTFNDIEKKTVVVIYRDTIIDAADPDITNNYVLRIWIHDDGSLQNYMQGKNFSAKVTVDAEAIEYTKEDCFTIDNYNRIIDYDKTCTKDVVIPKTINGITTQIGYRTEKKCDYYDNCEHYYYGAFYDKNLTSIIIPNTVTEIKTPLTSDNRLYGTFEKNNLTHITIPESIKEIGRRTFFDNNLTDIAIPGSITYIGDRSFYNNNLSNITISENVRNIGNYSFYNNKNLSNVILMEGITEINTYAFAQNNLTTIEIPNSVTKVMSNVFTHNINLEEIVVRNKTSLDDFIYSTGLKTTGELPSNVKITFRK